MTFRQALVGFVIVTYLVILAVGLLISDGPFWLAAGQAMAATMMFVCAALVFGLLLLFYAQSIFNVFVIFVLVVAGAITWIFGRSLQQQTHRRLTDFSERLEQRLAQSIERFLAWAEIGNDRI